MNSEVEFGYRVRALLEESCNDLDPAIIARLRVAREHALDAARVSVRSTKAATAVHHLRGGTLGLPGPGVWAGKVAAFASVLMLVLGLTVIGDWFDEDDDQELADLETALLADELPPSAYLDRGFQTFMKTNR